MTFGLQSWLWVDFSMLRLSSAASGERVAVVDLKDLEALQVKALRRYLAREKSCSPFQIRIFGPHPLEDERPLDAAEDLQVMILSPLPADELRDADFLAACGAGRVDEVRRFLEELQDPGRVSGLTKAAQHDHVEVVRLLLEAFASPDAEDGEGFTPLHVAARHGCVNVLKALLEARAELDASDPQEMTPLHLAASNGCEEVVAILLESKASQEVMYVTPMHLAAARGHSRIVGMLQMPSGPAHVLTPCHLAARGGHAEVVGLLLDRRAEVNARAGVSTTALHQAAWRGQIDVAQLLLSRKADPDVAEQQQLRPLHVAARNGHVAVVRCLLDAAAAVNVTDRMQETALHKAASHGHGKVVSLLLDFGAHRELPDQHGHTPLQLAGSTEVFRLLAAQAADVAARNVRLSGMKRAKRSQL